jgi:hypothetical protein
VVKNVSLDDAVEKVAADEAHLTINGSSGTADKVPLVIGVVRKGRVGVLEEGDGNYKGQYELNCNCMEKSLPSQWLTQR